jgi:hypothetical protein
MLADMIVFLIVLFDIIIKKQKVIIFNIVLFIILLIFFNIIYLTFWWYKNLSFIDWKCIDDNKWIYIENSVCFELDSSLKK